MRGQKNREVKDRRKDKLDKRRILRDDGLEVIVVHVRGQMIT